MTDVRTHWDEVWQDRDPSDTSWFQPRPETSHRLVTQVRPEADAAIVDVGGGASRLVDLLLDDGWPTITVVDIAAAALASARDRLGPRAGRVRWETADVTTYDHGGQVDVWHDRAVFHFLTEDRDRAAYVATCATTVRPGGHAVLATFAPDGPEQCSGLPVRRYGPEDLAGVFEPAFTPVRFDREVHLTPWETEQAFTYAVLRRRD